MPHELPGVVPEAIRGTVAGEWFALALARRCTAAGHGVAREFCQAHPKAILGHTLMVPGT